MGGGLDVLLVLRHHAAGDALGRSIRRHVSLGFGKSRAKKGLHGGEGIHLIHHVRSDRKRVVIIAILLDPLVSAGRRSLPAKDQIKH